MRKLLPAVIVMLLFTPSGPRCAYAAQADMYVLNMASCYPEWHPVVRDVLRPWVRNVLDLTGGRLVIRLTGPGVICPDDEIARGVRLGQAGMGHGIIGAEAARFPLNMICSLPLGLDNVMAGTAAFWRMQAELPELSGEFAGIKVLALHAAPPYQIYMVKDRVYGVRELKNKRILVANPYTAQMLSLLGAIPVLAPRVDFPSLLEDKSADGAMLTIYQARQLKLEGSLAQLVMADMPSGACWIGMHQGLWNMLPQDIRQVLTSTGGQKLSAALGAAMHMACREAIETLPVPDVEVHYLSDEERENILQTVRTAMLETWQKNARGAGVSTPRILYDKIRKIAADASAANRI